MKDIEKRDVRITCRITKSAEAMINFYEGESFSDKRCNIPDKRCLVIGAR